MEFDLITLPSLGIFYPDKRSTLMIRSLTANDEVLLTSPSIAQTGQATNMMLESVILDKNITLDNLMLCDKFGILLYLRSATYGDSMNVKIKCPHCSKSNETSFRLSEIEIKEVIELPDSEGLFSFTLPKYKIRNSPVTIKFKPLTVSIFNIISQELLSDTSEIKKNSTTKIKHQIVSINDKSDPVYIEKLIKTLPIIDFSALKSYIEKVEPGFNDKIGFVCPSCQHKFLERFDIDDQFLGLTPSYRQQILEETFLLFYYGHGITRKDAYDMTVAERKWTVNRISEEMEKKAKAEQDAMNRAKSKKG